ncbi:hypothetical protein G6F32_009539 [Rhizopus arrhizus]|nr:hypothetical protein G6F32_009539 [Rhizopus arrhizus]
MSASYNVEYNSQIQNPQQFASSVAELKRRAFVDRSQIENYDIKNWIGSVVQLYEQGDAALLNNDLENAYVAYMKGSTIMIEIIKFHSNYLKIRTDSIHIQLRKRTDEEILILLKDLAMKIDAWHSYQQQLQQMSTYCYNNYTPYPVYSYHDPYSINAQDSSSTIIRQNISSSQSPLRQAMPSSQPLSVSASSHDPSAKLNVSNNAIDLPLWTHHTFPKSITIEPLDLASRIQSQQNPPSILLVDVRSRERFSSGCIQHKWIIQIEPSVLHINTSVRHVEESLLKNPNIEQRLFAQRHRFDLIVYYDQMSRDVDATNIPMYTIKRILESHQLRRPPMMLVGGFDAWQAFIGERGVYKFPAVNNREKKNWFKSNASTSSVSTNESSSNSVYDYFTGKNESQQKLYLPISKPQPLPTAPRRESTTTRYSELMVNGPTIPFKNQVEPSQNHVTELRPAPPAQAKLQRRRTFIDNPFNGFTTTTSKLYDVPPVPTTNVASTSSKAAPLPSTKESSGSRPFTLGEFHHTSTSNIHQTPSSVFSQQGALIVVGTTGLKNLGNTCYMNSIIQCLSGTLPFARYFISGVFRQHVNRTNKLGTGGILTEKFADLLRAIWNENYNFVSPMSFREAIIRFAPRFSGTDQHDSQEFLTFLLDGIHEDVNLASHSHSGHLPTMTKQEELEFEKLPDWQASAMAWERYLSRNTSIVVSLFQGQYRSRLTCSSCKHTSTTYTPFMSLSLPIPAKSRLKISNVTLYQCLDYFVKEEVLEKDDAWMCPKCGKKRKATKQLMISRLPDVLLIHLKRFSADGLFKNKLDVMVKYPIKGLDLYNYVSRFIPPRPSSSSTSSAQDRTLSTYDLYAVSNHYGSLSGGHYTAYVKDGHRNIWHYFDDSKFSTCDESKVVVKSKVK